MPLFLLKIVSQRKVVIAIKKNENTRNVCRKMSVIGITEKLASYRKEYKIKSFF